MLVVSNQHRRKLAQPPPPIPPSRGKQLRAWRKAAGFTQETLEEAIGISQGKISTIERDEPGAILSFDEGDRWARVCGHTVEEIIVPPLEKPEPSRKTPNGERAAPREPEIHPLVRASLDDFLSRKGQALGEPIRRALAEWARGLNPNNPDVKIDDALWTEWMGVIFRLYGKAN